MGVLGITTPSRHKKWLVAKLNTVSMYETKIATHNTNGNVLPSCISSLRKVIITYV